jgi:hypothetical protein
VIYSTVRSSSSVEVGSIQCRSSKIINTGCRRASAWSCRSSARRCPLLLALRAQVERRKALTAGNRQHLGDQREVARFRPVAEQHLELVELCCVRVVAGKPCGALQLADKGVQRAVLIARRAEIAQSGVRLALDALRQRRGQARFADARLAGDQHHPPFAELRLLPAPQHQVELFVAADQWSGPRTQCLKTADDLALADHTPGTLWLGKPRKRLGAEILDLEQGADLSPGAVGNNQGARSGQRLQAGGEVWRLADDAPLLRGTRTDQIANHDEAAGDADPNAQRLLCGEPADRVDDRQPGAGRALGIIFMRLGISEINEHAVAHILSDKTAKAGDGVGHAAMVGADDLAQILGIEARGQRRRTDQIADHDGELAPLCLAPHPSLPRLRGRVRKGAGAERGDGVEQTAAARSMRRRAPADPRL